MALTVFRTTTSTRAAALDAAVAAMAFEKHCIDRDAHLMGISAEILATLVDISHSLAVIANSG